MITQIVKCSVALVSLLAAARDSSEPTAVDFNRQVRENPTAPPSEKVVEMPPESEPPPGGIQSSGSKGTRLDYQPSTGPGGKLAEDRAK